MSDSISEIDVLRITAGLDCDGDTIAITAATQPSLEDTLRTFTQASMNKEPMGRQPAQPAEPPKIP